MPPRWRLRRLRCLSVLEKRYICKQHAVWEDIYNLAWACFRTLSSFVDSMLLTQPSARPVLCLSGTQIALDLELAAHERLLAIELSIGEVLESLVGH